MGRGVLRRWGCLAAVAVGAGLLVGCGASTTVADGPGAGRGGGEALPANVTVREAGEQDDAPPLPDDVRATAARLAGLVDFHDHDLSGSWFDPEDGQLHVGVATTAGRDLLERKGLADDPGVVVEPAEHSLLEGQRLADSFVRHASFVDDISEWGALPEGDGFQLSVVGDHLTTEQLDELGALPVRVIVTLGVGRGSLD